MQRIQSFQPFSLYFTARMFLSCLLTAPPKETFALNLRGLRIWGPPVNPWKTIKIQACSQDPQKSEKVGPRLAKDSKITPKTIPQDTKLVNKWKRWNHSKTTVFIMVLAHTVTAFWQHFHPWIIKNTDLETVSHFGIPNHRQICKMCPKWVPGESQNSP